MSNKKSFASCYADIMLAHDLVSDMAGADGKPEKFDAKQVCELQRLTRSASASANAMNATHDGQPSE
jgi:hypothetical protein